MFYINIICSFAFLSLSFATLSMEKDKAPKLDPVGSSGLRDTTSFERLKTKLSAYLDARVEENIQLLSEIECPRNLKSMFSQMYPELAPNISLLPLDELRIMQAEYIQSTQTDISYFQTLKSRVAGLQMYHGDIDKLIFDIQTEIVATQDNIASKLLKKKKGAGPASKKTTKAHVDDDIRLENYIIDKLSPYQFGWFEYIKDFVKRSERRGWYLDGKGVVTNTPILLARKHKLFLEKDLPQLKAEHHLNDKIVQYMTENFSKKVKEFQDYLLGLNGNALDTIVIVKKASTITFLTRQYSSPVTISQLKDQFPDEKPTEIKQTQEESAGLPFLDPSSFAQPLEVAKQDFTLDVSLISQKKAEAPVQKPINPPVDVERTVKDKDSLLSTKHPTIIEERKRLKEERRQAQERARLWAQNVHRAHLKDADLTNNRDLISEFDWMNDLIDDQKTMTYSSIKEKLNKLANIKNGSGSKRHFIIYDTPKNLPVACYFHEPHPDEAVSLEKWRKSIVLALKKAGYYQLRKER